jgi:hypothetical protein
MAKASPVDRLYGEALAVIKLLDEKKEVSLSSAASDNFRKALLLGAASHFENTVTNIVIEFVRENTAGSVLIEAFLRNKAIMRQYHTWFSWEANNANQFFGLFGTEFRDMMTIRVKDDEALRLSIRAFLELGNERNLLVHEDYATFALEKTFEEIFELYTKARVFVETLPVVLRECDAKIKQKRAEPASEPPKDNSPAAYPRS